MDAYRWRDAEAVLASFQEGGSRVINHFTDGRGLRGIVRVLGRALWPGQSIVLRGAYFGYGANVYLAAAPGDIFVTDLPTAALPRELAGVGVFGPRGQYAISLGERALLRQGHRIIWTRPTSGRAIGTLPGGTHVRGPIVATRRW